MHNIEMVKRLGPIGNGSIGPRRSLAQRFETPSAPERVAYAPPSDRPVDADQASYSYIHAFLTDTEFGAHW